ncbi:HEAT repeat domain-containing protein [Streptomyces sp. ST2-7A]|uniref:HEAT repeat domain-containing protein n=1 Tax=Streptomyces sp. ST2-7A TaxID=2907214 RepID=UPI001F294642|nr:HEAT repeat domain-containing protein [Streptomyces sp. ST2-7A]MCE7079358.1 HEAT repeat domain-containing protein [Streptomyces sp. ST2-7A]
MHAGPFETDIAPSGSLLGLLRRGRGDGALHALAAPRTEAVEALDHCVRWDPRRDWRVEHRSLYYARLYIELSADLDAVEDHLAAHEELPIHTGSRGVSGEGGEERVGLAIAVLGHLARYGDRRAPILLRRHIRAGAGRLWALDELAGCEDDETLRALGPVVLAGFPDDREGAVSLGVAMRDAWEPRPWRLWEEDPARPAQGARLREARRAADFDRWRRQLRPDTPRPDWSVDSVLARANRDREENPDDFRPDAAARCLAVVAGPDDRPLLRSVARAGAPGERITALRYLAERGDPAAPGLLRDATAPGSHEDVARAALLALTRMRGDDALALARALCGEEGGLPGASDPTPAPTGVAAGVLLARHGSAADGPTVLESLRTAVRWTGDPLIEQLLPDLVDGVGRLGPDGAAPLLRHLYRETLSSLLRGRTAPALAATDPSFPAGFAVECLWDCEQDTRETAARFATTGDARVVERLRRLAADPAEWDEVQSAVRGRLDGTPGR